MRVQQAKPITVTTSPYDPPLTRQRIDSYWTRRRKYRATWQAKRAQYSLDVHTMIAHGHRHDLQEVNAAIVARAIVRKALLDDRSR